MRLFFTSFYVLLYSFLFCQEVIYSEDLSLKKIPPGSVLADLGEDITASSLTTIILDGSRSQPQNGSLTYEWLFPPNMIGADDYNFSDSDTPIYYDLDRDGRGCGWNWELVQEVLHELLEERALRGISGYTPHKQSQTIPVTSTTTYTFDIV